VSKRTFAWLSRNRRRAKDFQAIASAKTRLLIVSLRLLGKDL
jgi:hypothetical protein